MYLYVKFNILVDALFIDRDTHIDKWCNKKNYKNLVYLHETKDCFACIYHMHGVLKQQTNHQPIFMTMTNRNIYYHCIWHHLTRSARLIHGQGVWSDYSIVCNQWSNPANKIKMEEPQRDALPYCVISVVYWWLMLDHWLPLYWPQLQVKLLWYQEEGVDVWLWAILGKDGDSTLYQVLVTNGSDQSILCHLTGYITFMGEWTKSYIFATTSDHFLHDHRLEYIFSH